MKKKLTFSDMFSFRQELAFWLIPLLSTVFLTFYNQLVCPFLESLPFHEELLNLMIVFAVQVILRAVLLRTVPAGWGVASLGKRFYRIMVASWLFAGLAAAVLHELAYNNIDPAQVHFTSPWASDYPWHSHLKVLSGYWFLGAGLLSQLELTFGERYIRQYIRNNPETGFQHTEKISSRITRGNFFYTFVPSVSVLIMVIRYALQDKIIPLGITLEFAYIGIVFIAAAILAAVLYGKMLREDTRAIVGAIKQIGRGDFNVQLIATRQDELGQVAVGINEMAGGLVQRERIRDSFGHFVSPEIAEQFISQYTEGKDMRGYGERKNVAVLMCDIRNFSGLSESMDPSDVTKMLNNYFDQMVKAIENNGGIVDKFIGDAVMAVFGLLGDPRECALQAVRAAVEMRTALQEANRLNTAEGLPSLENGTGIHFGEVIATYTGSSQRLEFTIIGSTVNTAARLEAQAKKPNPPIIISQSVAARVCGEFTVFGGKEKEMKGVGRHKIYSVRF